MTDRPLRSRDSGTRIIGQDRGEQSFRESFGDPAEWTRRTLDDLDARHKAGADNVPFALVESILLLPDSNTNYFATKEVIGRILAYWGHPSTLARCSDPKRLRQIGQLHNRCARCEAAVQWLHKAWIRAECVFGPDSDFTIEVLDELSGVMEVGGVDSGIAEDLGQRVLEHRRQTGSEDNPSTFWPLMNQATRAFERGDDDEALTHLAAARTVWSKHPYFTIDGLQGIVDCLQSYVTEATGSLWDTACEFASDVLRKTAPELTELETEDAAQILGELAGMAADTSVAIKGYQQAISLYGSLGGQGDIMLNLTWELTHTILQPADLEPAEIEQVMPCVERAVTTARDAHISEDAQGKLDTCIKLLSKLHEKAGQVS